MNWIFVIRAASVVAVLAGLLGAMHWSIKATLAPELARLRAVEAGMGGIRTDISDMRKDIRDLGGTVQHLAGEVGYLGGRLEGRNPARRKKK